VDVVLHELLFRIDCSEVYSEDVGSLLRQLYLLIALTDINQNPDDLIEPVAFP